jgi:hypothetical protein
VTRLRRPMRPRAAVLALALVPALALAGCGKGQEKGEALREGLDVKLNDVVYTVFITRELNIRDAEDRAYFGGPEAPPGSALYGVFLQACNQADSFRSAVSDFRIRDSQGGEFEPQEVPRHNLFAYRPRKLQPGGCIPAKGSIPTASPTGGAMLLFKLPLGATENRPLELEFESQGEKARIELDI